MQVFLTGASGFIGRHLASALAASGHQLVLAGRGGRPGMPGARTVAVDFSRDFDAAVWAQRLEGVDAVINTVGIFRERGRQSFGALHIRAPQALFNGCVRAGVRRVIHVSALGADEAATTAFHLSKRATDDFLLRLPLAAVVVQPSLVYGDDGASSRLFNAWATLPLLPVPGAGRQPIQPIHIDDLVATMLALLEREAWRSGVIPLVGPQSLTVREYLAALRNQMSREAALGRPHFVPLPLPLVKTGVRLLESLPGVLFDRAALSMLERGNTADPAPVAALLARPPRPVASFIAPGTAFALAQQAQLTWLRALLALSLAIVWLATAWVSLVSYPRAESYALLARVGLSGDSAALALWSAALLDLVLGLATIAHAALDPGWRRALWASQIVLIIVYTAIIHWALPEFWTHPFGPVLKNFVLLAVLLLLYRTEPR